MDADRFARVHFERLRPRTARLGPCHHDEAGRTDGAEHLFVQAKSPFRISCRVESWVHRAMSFDPTASACLAPTSQLGWPAAIRWEAHVNYDDLEGDRSPRSADPAERAKLAELFQAIGSATNATILDMPHFSNEVERRQMVHTFATVGGFVTYGDMLLQRVQPVEPDGVTAVIELGRSLSRRIQIKAS
jgi:hypothetical protein